MIIYRKEIPFTALLWINQVLKSHVLKMTPASHKWRQPLNSKCTLSFCVSFFLFAYAQSTYGKTKMCSIILLTFYLAPFIVCTIAIYGPVLKSESLFYSVTLHLDQTCELFLKITQGGLKDDYLFFILFFIYFYFLCSVMINKVLDHFEITLVCIVDFKSVKIL